MSAHRSSRIRPRLQLLEDRLAPASATLANGTLTIDFTAAGAGAEAVQVANNGSSLTLSGNITGQSLPVSSVSKIVAQDLSGGSAQSLLLSGNSFTLSGGVAATGIEDVTFNGSIATNGSPILVAAPNNIIVGAGLNTAGGALTLSADSDGDGVGGLTVGVQFLSGTWTQQARLYGSDGTASAQMGTIAVSADGNTAFLGNSWYGTASAGDVYVFARQGNNWVQQQKIPNPEPIILGLFGQSIAPSADGNSVLIGAPFNGPTVQNSAGAVYYFTRNAGNWTLSQKLSPSNPALNDTFGFSSSMTPDGKTAILGAPIRNAAFSFTRGSSWSQQQELQPGGSSRGALTAISADGRTALIGSEHANTAFVYTLSGGSWGSPQELAGPGVINSLAVSGSGDTLLLGSGARYGGSSKVSFYARTASGWQQQQVLTNPDGGTGGFGQALALSVDGATALIGAPGQTVNALSGAAHVYSLTPTGWVRTQRLTPADGLAHGEFGYAVSMSGDASVLVVNADKDDVGVHGEQGSMFVFSRPVSGGGGNFSLNAGSGSVTIRAATVSVSTSISGGAVTLTPSKPGNSIRIGGAALGSLNLTDSLLDRITTPLLQLGDNQTGSVLVSGVVTRAATTKLALVAGGAIAIAADVDSAGGDILLDAGGAITQANGKVFAFNSTITLAGPGPVNIAGAGNIANLLVIPAGMTVKVDGSLQFPGDVQASGVLAGKGLVGAVTALAGGGVAPDGVLTVGGLTLNTNSTFTALLNGSSPGAFSQLKVNGGVNLGGAKLAAQLNFGPIPNSVIRLIDNDGADPVLGTFAGLLDGTEFTLNGRPVRISYTGGDGNDVTLTALTPSVDLEASVGDNGVTTPGTLITYTVVVANHGPHAADQARLTLGFTEQLSDAHYFAVATGGAIAPPAADGTVVDSLTLPANSTITFTVTATIAPSATGTLVVSPRIRAAAFAIETDPINNNPTSSITLTPKSDLAVSAAATRPRVNQGSNDTFTFTLNTLGPSDAQGVTLSAPVPANMTFVSFSAPAGWTVSAPSVGGTGTITATRSTLAAGGADQKFSLVAKAGDTVTVGATLSSSVTVTTTTTDSVTLNNSATAKTTVIPMLTEFIATGAGAGGGPHVKVFNKDGTLRTEFYAYTANTPAGVRVATGDVNGDGFADIIVSPGAGNGPHVRIFSVASGAPVLLGEFFAFSANMNKGVYIAAGDVNNDGLSDIVCGTGSGVTTEVRVFNATALGGAAIKSFNPYPGYPVGVTVAAGDFNGDGNADVVTGPEDGNPHVKVFDVSNSAYPILRSFFPYAPQYAVGAHVAAGDFNGDGQVDIAVGTVNRIAPGGPHVRIHNGIDTTVLREFYADVATFTGGIRVAFHDTDGDGKAELFTGTGPGTLAKLRKWRGGTAELISEMNPYNFGGGIYVG